MRKRNISLEQKLAEASSSLDQMKEKVSGYEELKSEAIRLQHESDIFKEKLSKMQQMETKLHELEKSLKAAEESASRFKQISVVQDKNHENAMNKLEFEHKNEIMKINLQHERNISSAVTTAKKETEEKFQGKISLLEEQIISLREEKARLLYQVESFTKS